ncbi:MAG TPA: protocatechuate 3,4-dioxygenase [Steroidobacteraceae bacterium]|nr:protocatechuate 3,4-dioxygenase [Steroidobacteraceae bacterium]
MKITKRLSRRWLLTSGACATVAALGPLSAAEKLRRTPTQVLGPFYPLEKPLDDDADLTMVKGRKARAKGQVVHVMGRVVNADGEPVKGARIEIWQANANGRYTHPSDDNPAPLDPNFEGYAKLLTDADGRYRFKTIKPAAYPAGDIMRPPHIHFDVAGKVNRLVTQMYFPGEPLNVDDVVLAVATKNKHLLVADVRPPTPDLEPESLLARWDIVLENG